VGVVAVPALYTIMSAPRTESGRQHPLAADATTCTCAHIMLGSERTEARNWNPDCPEHGTESEWYRSEAQVLHRQVESIRGRVLQAVARLRRQDRIALEDAKDLIEALEGTGHWSGEIQEV